MPEQNLEECRERILSNDYRDFISTYSEDVLNYIISKDGTCTQVINSKYCILYIKYCSHLFFKNYMLFIFILED